MHVEVRAVALFGVQEAEEFQELQAAVPVGISGPELGGRSRGILPVVETRTVDIEFSVLVHVVLLFRRLLHVKVLVVVLRKIFLQRYHVVAIRVRAVEPHLCSTHRCIHPVLVVPIMKLEDLNKAIAVPVDLGKDLEQALCGVESSPVAIAIVVKIIIKIFVLVIAEIFKVSVRLVRRNLWIEHSTFALGVHFQVPLLNKNARS
mmetsp:Transcript_33465/g.79378  ORF Transcript_33465/g.79378 Transcript_33465/m.79378 type:complete len:204 (-) Transcript_33465:324-935(-)